MQPESQILVPGQTASSPARAQNRVLRNTYMLLALSMVPTVLGAWLGVQFKFSFFSGSPVIGIVLFLAIAFGFFYGIEKTKNSGWGVALLLGFILHGPCASAHAGCGPGLRTG
jgi:FtsH-binding integral membrane protein